MVVPGYDSRRAGPDRDIGGNGHSAPLLVPADGSTADDLSSNLLSGTVTGLDPRDCVHLRLESVGKGGVEGRGQILERFAVTNGRWQQPRRALPPGHYRLVPDAPGYVQGPHSIVLQILDERIVWRYTELDFDFLHPADAVAGLGLPLCPAPSSPVIPVTPVHDGTRSATSRPGSTASGRCYANHLADVRLEPAGLRGRMSGLPDGQIAAVAICALPPSPNELYGQGEPPSPDSG